MPEEKGLGSKLLGLFVEVDQKDEAAADDAPAGEPGEKSAAELVAELAQGSDPRKAAGAAPPPGPAPRPPVVSIPTPVGPVKAAAVDFDEVFRAAGLEAADLDRVRKAEDLLRSLPEATPQEIKRQIVEASLKAFGFDVQKIVAAAQNQTKALDTWTRLKEQQTAKAITDAQAQIAQLEDKIITARADITRRSEELASLGAAAVARKGQVAQVLAFFATAPTPPKPAP